MPKYADVELQSTAPYSASRKLYIPRGDKESWEDYEERVWREKSNYDENGIVYIPAMAFKQAVDAAAKMFSEKIPGKGNATYTKHFKSGALCMADLSIGVHRDDMPEVRINANADGVRGSGKRVIRVFPQVSKWSGSTRFAVLDDTITPGVFEKVVKNAGQFIGVGRFRRENGGMNGAFVVSKITWSDI